MKTIAVVEDNPDNLLLVSALLEGHFATEPYEDGLSALVGIGRSRPDLVLLDISLPGMDGTEVLERLRKDKRLTGMPIVAVTAHAMQGDRAAYLSLGFDGYISKPIVDETLLLGTIVGLLAQPQPGAAIHR